MIKFQNEKDVLELVKQDEWMMQVLNAAAMLNPPDWWVCAGFVRTKIWDTLHNFSERTILPDVDVVYFDKTNLDESKEKKLEQQLRHLLPDVPWSVKNEARMHLRNDLPPYTSSVDAIAKFPETATALGLTIDKTGDVMLTAPHGINDVIQLKVKPTPYFIENKGLARVYEERIRKKDWQSIWHKLDVCHIQVTG
ncbi:nucleotidyltransferase family protein [Lentibacillus sp.]|uniref:nucleotidyltransferase family protein n=1 Tax=Lentibacillus sp. TaxID=1925746 RepID=UPI002B4B1B69|nr:nucleotidyltransferase family protein [Lentibacillus sp.]HLS09088.1 nucleotidyltransferase family protein [Lentibacillus sp.]